MRDIMKAHDEIQHLTNQINQLERDLRHPMPFIDDNEEYAIKRQIYEMKCQRGKLEQQQPSRPA